MTVVQETSPVQYRLNIPWKNASTVGLIREAIPTDASKIVALFQTVYGGTYPFSFGQDPLLLAEEIRDTQRSLWMVAETTDHKIVGATFFAKDLTHRLGKASGAVVDPSVRHAGLGTALLKAGVHYFTEVEKSVDVIYGTTRTVNEGPSRMVTDVGFIQLGIFPNGLLIEQFENLNLDIYFAKQALEKRRHKPYLHPPFAELYNIARKKLGLERAYLVTERPAFSLSRKPIKFSISKEANKSIQLFRFFYEQKRLAKSFFPFHEPNWTLSTEDGGTDVFVWFGGAGRQASIIGYRTDRINIQDLLNSTALTLQKAGAAYIELLVDAYDYIAQQEALVARFIPSAYFPGMSLAPDGYRDDYFVLSRTFQLLDFNNSTMQIDNYEFLQTYLKFYDQLYMKPMIKRKK